MPPPLRLRSRAIALLAGSGVVLGACSSAAPSTPSVAQRIPPSRMLTASDLGPGWAPANVDLSALPCSVPRSAAIVGAGGYAVRQAQAGGSPSVVEFAGEVSSPGQSYISAIDYLQTSESCRRTTGDHTQTSTFEGVLPLPRQGDRSVAMVFSNAVDGASSQTGYEVVRTGHIVAVVGYTDAGTLDAAQLQNVTSTAVGKLTG